MKVNSIHFDLITKAQNQANRGMKLVMGNYDQSRSIPQEIRDITTFIKTLIFTDAIENGVEVPISIRLAVEEGVITAFFLGKQEKNKIEGFTE